ncbi:MAG: NAD-dependent succinate-semialdehyde dehydrogenase [Sorangiineae bacterium]|nr:NAD-dependent succinate-semialdehyde dehydrogenase [Polyangiaceae bacterium]MEB2322100.1 NAD-dependent succinate-semialdehyde dehydrogenase [Sorangiineae bacterium]
MRSIDPSTGRVFASYEVMSLEAAVRAVEATERASRGWRERPIAERAAVIARVGKLLRERKLALAELMVREMGKPVVQAEAEVEKCAWVCEHYAEHGPAYLAPEPVATDASESLVRFDPLGVVLAVMPWNFPLWQVFRFAAPALLAGNAGALKHAPNVCGSALAIRELWSAAGLPGGVFEVLFVSDDDADRLIAHPAVSAVTLTGSGRAGRAVGAAAGAALKQVVLELGGSDAFIVLADAALERAAEVAVKARMQNNGQSCIAAKRFIVERAVAARFEALVVERVRALRVGSPLERETELGPLARADLRDALARQVDASVAAGARLLTGGRALPGPGFFYEPTVLAEVAPGMPAFDEETFGPLAALTVASDAEHALALANRSSYGLGCSLFTRDLGRARALAARVEAGSVFVNEMVKSDPRLPFGGVKASGHGRELGREGARAFTNVKTVYFG